LQTLKISQQFFYKSTFVLYIKHKEKKYPFFYKKILLLLLYLKKFENAAPRSGAAEK